MKQRTLAGRATVTRAALAASVYARRSGRCALAPVALWDLVAQRLSQAGDATTAGPGSTRAVELTEA
jgi:hypothetical protein